MTYFTYAAEFLLLYLTVCLQSVKTRKL